MVRSDLLPASSRRKYFALLAAALASLLLLCLLAPPLSAQQASFDHAAQVRRVIDNAVPMHLTPAQLGGLWEQLASDYHEVAQFDKAEEAYGRALHLLEPIPTSRQDYALTLQNLGTLYMVTDRLDAAFNCQKHALKIDEEIGDPALIARGQGHLADVYLAMGKHKQALRYSTSALEATRRMPVTPQSDLDWMLITHAYSLCLSSRCGEGLTAMHEALPLVLADFGKQSFPAGEAYVALGYIELRDGSLGLAEDHLREGVRVLRLQLAPEHPLLLHALNIYHDVLAKNHHDAEAHQIAEEQRVASEQGRNCSGCTISIQGLRGR